MSAVPVIVTFAGVRDPSPEEIAVWYGGQLVAQRVHLSATGRAATVRNHVQVIRIGGLPANRDSVQADNAAVYAQVLQALPALADHRDFYSVVALGVRDGGMAGGQLAVLGEQWLEADAGWAVAHEWGHVAGLSDLSSGFHDPLFSTESVMAYGSRLRFPEMDSYFLPSEVETIKRSPKWEEGHQMRQDYPVVRDLFPATVAQVPKRIVIHRQGNPGARAQDAVDWGQRTGAFSVHRYVDTDGTVFYTQEHTQHAHHVKEARIARDRGLRVDGPYGVRGDYDSFGIETCDVFGGGPGQAYSLLRETRISLVILCRDALVDFGLRPEDITEHADWDPWERPDDLGQALYIPDLREDVRDLLEGREPWRTVQEFAFGGPAPIEWKPAPQPEPVPAGDLIAQQLFIDIQRLAAQGLEALK